MWPVRVLSCFLLHILPDPVLVNNAEWNATDTLTKNTVTGVLRVLGHIQSDVRGQFFPQMSYKETGGGNTWWTDQLQVSLSASPRCLVTFLGRCLSGYTNNKYKLHLLNSGFQPCNQTFKFKSAVYQKISIIKNSVVLFQEHSLTVTYDNSPLDKPAVFTHLGTCILVNAYISTRFFISPFLAAPTPPFSYWHFRSSSSIFISHTYIEIIDSFLFR